MARRCIREARGQGQPPRLTAPAADELRYPCRGLPPTLPWCRRLREKLADSADRRASVERHERDKGGAPRRGPSAVQIELTQKKKVQKVGFAFVGVFARQCLSSRLPSSPSARADHSPPTHAVAPSAQSKLAKRLVNLIAGAACRGASHRTCRVAQPRLKGPSNCTPAVPCSRVTDECVANAWRMHGEAFTWVGGHRSSRGGGRSRRTAPRPSRAGRRAGHGG